MGDVLHWTLLASVAVLGAGQVILVFGLFGGTGIWGPDGSVMKATRVVFFGAIYGSVWSILVRRRDWFPPPDCCGPR